MSRLDRSLRTRIQEHGPLSFAEFMALALYDPEHGYYARGQAPGRAGDFFTAADLGPGLALLLATQLQDLVERAPEVARLVELGPGSGRLLARLLAVLEDETPDLLARLEVVAVEPAVGLATRQRETLATWRERVCWRALDALAADPRPAMVFGNEVVDALPVHRLRVREGRLSELGVGSGGTGDRLAWVEMPPAPEAAAIVASWPTRPPDGCVFEVRPGQAELVRGLAAAVPRGLVLLLDYGDTRDSLFGPARPAGTVRAYRGHELVEPLAAPGEQDLTASVDFTALGEDAVAAGLDVQAVRPLTEAALALGGAERIAALSRAADRAAASARLSLLSLISPGGFGASFKAFVATRGAVGEVRAAAAVGPGARPV